MKKFISLVLALAMILMVGSVFADGDGETTTPAAASLPTAEISITNLEEGDIVSLYKVLKWNSEKADWDFNDITVDGYTKVDDLVKALNGNDAADALTALAAAVKTKITADVTVGSSKEYTYTGEVGSYLALIKGATGTIYNPMILSVNFDYSKNPTGAADGTLDADEATAAKGETAVAKKQTITLEKEVKSDKDIMNDVAVDDVIPFIVRTQTPNYGDNYTSPKFIITDTLSAGLTFNKDAVVKDGAGATLTDPTDYSIENKDNGYVITFTTAYLHKVKANTAITVEYTAKVNELTVMHQVERYTNDVTLKYSNSPTTEDDSLHDKTNHYTFSIDAYLTGESGGSGSEVTRELIKVGVDGEGNVLTEFVTGEEKNWEWADEVTPLENATFTLVGNSHTYNGTSDENGYVRFVGLDAGEYELTETSAPAGYKFSKKPVPVVISATYYRDVDASLKGDHADDELYSYSITINGTATSTYTVTNDGGYTITETKVVDGGITYPINNVRAVTLPSTGGIGTTIFYILGGLLVVGAVVILIARRKAQD